MPCAKVISNENYNLTSTDETCTDVKDQSIPTKVGNAISNTDTKKTHASIHQHCTIHCKNFTMYIVLPEYCLCAHCTLVSLPWE